jgi:hypothetical protein
VVVEVHQRKGNNPWPRARAAFSGKIMEVAKMFFITLYDVRFRWFLEMRSSLRESPNLQVGSGRFICLFQLRSTLEAHGSLETHSNIRHLRE